MSRRTHHTRRAFTAVLKSNCNCHVLTKQYYVLAVRCSVGGGARKWGTGTARGGSPWSLCKSNNTRGGYGSIRCGSCRDAPAGLSTAPKTTRVPPLAPEVPLRRKSSCIRIHTPIARRSDLLPGGRGRV